MEQRLEKIEKRLEQMGNTLHEIDKTLLRQEGEIKEHIRRTTVSERRQTLLEKQLQREIGPIKRHVEGVNYLLKAVGVLSLCVSFAYTAIKLKEALSQERPSGDKSNAQVSEMRLPPKPKPAK